MIRMCYFAGIVLLFVIGMLLRDGLETWAIPSWEIAKSSMHFSPEKSASSAAATVASIPWRRTKNGWEDSRTWSHNSYESGDFGDAQPMSIHPLVIALLQVLASVGALLWFSPPFRRQNAA